MKSIMVGLILICLGGTGHLTRAKESMETRTVPAIMAVTGAGIAGVWTADILSGKQVDMSQGFFKARDPQSRSLMWPHWLAEYSTAAGLMVGAYGLYKEKSWGKNLALVSVGALTYTSLNSLSWSLAKKERMAYAIPMLIGLSGAGISLVILF